MHDIPLYSLNRQWWIAYLGAKWSNKLFKGSNIHRRNSGNRGIQPYQSHCTHAVQKKKF
jgi:hypothetical protein